MKTFGNHKKFTVREGAYFRGNVDLLTASFLPLISLVVLGNLQSTQHLLSRKSFYSVIVSNICLGGKEWRI